MFAGLDVGTTCVKFAVYDRNGAAVAEESFPHGAVAEGRVCFEKIWTAAEAAIAGCKDVAPQVEALAISAFGEAVATADIRGHKIEGLLESRQSREGALERLFCEVGGEALYRITGLIPAVHFPLIALAGRKGPLPPGRRVLFLEDFLIHRLTGEFVLSNSSAARSMMYDIEKERWSARLLRFAGLEEEELPRVVPSGRRVAPVTPAVAERLGLPQKAMVAAGGHDQMCSALGAGAGEEGVLVNCSGTVESIGLFLQDGREEPRRAAQMQRCPCPVPGRIFTFYAPVKGCSTLDRFAAAFATAQVEEAKGRGIHPNQYLQSLCEETPSRLLTVPYFGGRGFPNPNPFCRGAVFGADAAVKPEEVYQSILEGIAFEVRRCMEIYRSGGIPVSVVRSVGGGAWGDYWLQIKADIWGIPVERVKTRQCGVLGAAVLAGMQRQGQGKWGRFVQEERVFRPNPVRVELYEQKYQKYCEILKKYDLENAIW